MPVTVIDLPVDATIEVPVAALRWYVLQPRGCVSRVDGDKYPLVPWVFHDAPFGPVELVSILFEEKEGVPPHDAYLYRRADGAVAVAIPAEWARVSAVVKAALRANLPGWREDWSPEHRPVQADSFLDRHVDGAIRTPLRRVHLAGTWTTSSCQGGYVPISTDALAKWGGSQDPDWTPGPTVGDKVWGRKRPHLFVYAGPGHGGGGVAVGAAEMRRVVPGGVVDAADALRDKFWGIPGLSAEIVAAETESYVALTTVGFPTDAEAEAWWAAVVAAVEGR